MPEQQQPLSVVAAASIVTGQLLGLYLGYVMDDELYEMGATPAERAYREYLHNFSVEVPPGAVRCEQQAQNHSTGSSRVTKHYVLDASDCCYEDDLLHPSNPVVHVLDYRAFARDWKVDHKRSVKGGPNAVLLPYSINYGPCAGQVGLALVAAADIRPGEA
jgi:hypothetical protein